MQLSTLSCLLIVGLIATGLTGCISPKQADEVRLSETSHDKILIAASIVKTRLANSEGIDAFFFTQVFADGHSALHIVEETSLKFPDESYLCSKELLNSLLQDFADTNNEIGYERASDASIAKLTSASREASRTHTYKISTVRGVGALPRTSCTVAVGYDPD